MWFIGLIGIYAIYRLIFRWIMVSTIKMGHNPLLVPRLLRYPSFHYSIYAVAFCIFCFSTYCFYTTNPWMVLLSPALLFVAMLVHGAKTSSERDKIIGLAVKTQISMQDSGYGPARINDAICLSTLGAGSELGMDWGLKELLKHYILPTLGLFAASGASAGDDTFDASALGQYQKDSAEIDAIVDKAYHRLSSVRDA